MPIIHLPGGANEIQISLYRLREEWRYYFELCFEEEEEEQEQIASEAVTFNFFPGCPPRARAFGSDEDRVIARALYGDPNVPIIHLPGGAREIQISPYRLREEWRSEVDVCFEEEEEERIESEFFTLGSPNSWHLAVPAGRLSDYELQEVHQAVERRLSGVPVPPLNAHRSGVRFTAEYGATHGDQPSAAHLEWLSQQSLASIGYPNPDPTTVALWQTFRFMILPAEGDTSAIQAWDEQVVTIGPGFAGSTGGSGRGQAGAVYARMPEAFRGNLYWHGIFFSETGDIAVLASTPRGVQVRTGNAAWRVIRRDYRRLGLLIRAAQSPGARQPMLRAQFQQFLRNNRRMPPDFPERGRQLFFIACRLVHWLPVVQWTHLRDVRSVDVLRQEAISAIRTNISMSDDAKQRWISELTQGWHDRVERPANAGVQRAREAVSVALRH